MGVQQILLEQQCEIGPLQLIKMPKSGLAAHTYQVSPEIITPQAQWNYNVAFAHFFLIL